MKDFTTTKHVHTSYEVNGARYERLDDIPVEFRKYFEDRNGNGIPDYIESVTEGTGSVLRFEKSTVARSTTLTPALRRQLSGMFESPDPVLDGRVHDDLLRCAECGYDLRESRVSGKCPECGHAVSSSICELIQPQRSISRLILELLVNHPRLVVSAAVLAVVFIYIAFAIWRAVF